MLPLSDDLDFVSILQSDWYSNGRKRNQLDVVGFIRCSEYDAVVQFDGKHYAVVTKDETYDRFEISYKTLTLAIEGNEPFPTQYFTEDKEYDPFGTRNMLNKIGRYSKLF